MAIDAASDMLTILLTVYAIKMFNTANIINKKVNQYLNNRNIYKVMINNILTDIFILILNKEGGEIPDFGVHCPCLNSVD